MEKLGSSFFLECKACHLLVDCSKCEGDRVTIATMASKNGDLVGCGLARRLEIVYTVADSLPLLLARVSNPEVCPPCDTACTPAALIPGPTLIDCWEVVSHSPIGRNAATCVHSNPGSSNDQFDWEGRKIKGNRKKTPRKCPFQGRNLKVTTPEEGRGKEKVETCSVAVPSEVGFFGVQ